MHHALKSGIAIAAILAASSLTASANSDVEVQTRNYVTGQPAKSVKIVDTAASAPASVSAEVSQLLAQLSATPAQSIAFSKGYAGSSSGTQLSVTVAGGAKTIKVSQAGSNHVIGQWTMTAATPLEQREAISAKAVDALGILPAHVKRSSQGQAALSAPLN